MMDEELHMTTVLIVEENKELLESLSQHLQSCRFQILAAQNGADAVAHARSDHPDVILMGRKDGADLNALAQIRANAATRGIPVLTLAAECLQFLRRPSA
jgi:CheY-like chemotaxis protein